MIFFNKQMKEIIIQVQKYLFNSINLAAVILFHKAQNSLIANDHHTVTTVITTQIHKYYHIMPKISNRK
jgi:hypothetical protein